MMTTGRDQVVARYGQDLYRLALLLTDDQQRAEQAILTTFRHLSATDAADEAALVRVLLAALPPDSARTARKSSWIATHLADSSNSSLIAAWSRLPRSQRLALALTLLRSYTDQQIGDVVGEQGPGDALPTAHDGLLGLYDARYGQGEAQRNGLLGTLPEAFDDACRPVRHALAAGDDRLSFDPALRGHLALCPACRAVQQRLAGLATDVEAMFRGALRPVVLPETLVERLHAAPRPSRITLQPSWRLALVPLAVLALIAVMIWPRGRAAVAPTAAPDADASEIIRRAQTALYQPPGANGVWEGRWHVFWMLPDGAAAPMTGTIWRNMESGQTRMQLVHEQGGGPYEFLLGNGRDTLWYAVAPRYGNALYPLLFSTAHTNIQVDMQAAEQQTMIQRRLNSGAWGLANEYLRQASRAQLQRWGRQQAADGTSLEVIGFRGESPISPPTGEPDAPATETTILLTIDPATGTLYEAREINGVRGSTQAGRVMVRFDGWHERSDPADNASLFEVQRAWNGVGSFVRVDGAIDPDLPLLANQYHTTPAYFLQQPAIAPQVLPLSLPSTIDQAQIIVPQQVIFNAAGDDTFVATWVYRGPGQTVMVRNGPSTRVPPIKGQQLQLNNRTAMVRAGAGRSFVATVPAPGGVDITMVYAQGLNWSAFVDVMNSLHPLDFPSYQAQQRLFRSARLDDRAYQLLLGALAQIEQQPADGTVHSVVRQYARQSSEQEQLRDPYHRPLHRTSAWREYESWVSVANHQVRQYKTVERNDDGSIAATNYGDRFVVWQHEPQFQQATLLPTYGDYYWQQANWRARSGVLDALTCASGQATTLPNGEQAVVVLEPDWLKSPCVLMQLSVNTQRGPAFWQNNIYLGNADSGAYVVDLINRPMSRWYVFDAQGALARIETRAGNEPDAELVEALQFVKSEQIAAMPIIDRAVPDAVVVRDYRQGASFDTVSESPLSQEQALQQLGTMVTPPPNDQLIDKQINRAGPGHELYFQFAGTFDSVYYSGTLLRFDFLYRTSQRTIDSIQMFQGDASTVRAYLRATYRWQASEPLVVTVDDQLIDGWLVVGEDASRWALFEVGETFVALRMDSATAQDMLQKLISLSATG